MSNYHLVAIGDSRWLCVDQLTGVSVEWDDKRFNDTQEFKIASMPEGVEQSELATALARMAGEMAQWLADNHRPKMEPMSEEALTSWTREKVGRQVRELRKAKGLTLADVATLSGVTINHISRIEHGKYSVKLDTIAKLAASLGGNIEI